MKSDACPTSKKVGTALSRENSAACPTSTKNARARVCARMQVHDSYMSTGRDGRDNGYRSAPCRRPYLGEPLQGRDMNRKQVLDAAAACVLHDRNDQYSNPEDSFAIIADLWSVYWQAAGRANFEAHDVAVMMALLKVARLTSNPTHADSWVDLAGYAACGAECAQGTVQLDIVVADDLEVRP